MMFVYGEVADPLDTTSCLVEDIVRNQLDQIIKLSTQQSSRRGNRYLAAEDLIFAMRHDRDKTSRLRTFLSWKDVRRNAKDDKIEKVDQLVEDDIDTNVQEKTRKKARVKFTWDSLYTMANILSDDEDEEEDEEEKAAYLDQADRLLAADTMTQSMSKDEYIYYSECRQASFTYKKSKKFREFVDMSKYISLTQIHGNPREFRCD